MDKPLYNRIYIEITNICNLNCSFCPIEQRDKDVMAISDFEKIIAQAGPLATQVCLHLMGEPLAHPKFPQILELCEKYGVKVQLTTNGLLIEKYRELIAASPAIRQVNFSLQSYFDNFPSRDFTPYLNTVNDFIQYTNQLAPHIYMNLRLWNLDQGNDLLVIESNEKIFKYFEDKLAIEIKRSVDVGGIKSKRIWNKLYLHFDSRFEWPRMELPIQGDLGRCNALKDHFAIHANGTVVPCCLDDQAEIILGNCLTDSLLDILKGHRAKSMKEGFERGQLLEELCQRCSYINRFKKTR